MSSPLRKTYHLLLLKRLLLAKMGKEDLSIKEREAIFENRRTLVNEFWTQSQARSFTEDALDLLCGQIQKGYTWTVFSVRHYPCPPLLTGITGQYESLEDEDKEKINHAVDMKVNEFISNCYKIKHESKRQPLKNELIRLPDWTNTRRLLQQYCDYLAIADGHQEGLIKKVSCTLFTKSEYYRFGFKFFPVDGKALGEQIIKSYAPELFVHIGINKYEHELFVTSYHNGNRPWLLTKDKYIGVYGNGGQYGIEFTIDSDGIFKFYVNRAEVYSDSVRKELRRKINMISWADDNEYKVTVENIIAEFENE